MSKSSHDLFLDVTEIEPSDQALARRARNESDAATHSEVTGEELIVPEGFDPLKSASGLIGRFFNRLKKNWNS